CWGKFTARHCPCSPPPNWPRSIASIFPTLSRGASNLDCLHPNCSSLICRGLPTRCDWTATGSSDSKHYDGSIREIERIPAELKEVYRTAFEIEPRWLIECASRRQKWIDMGHSLNLYLAQPSGMQLSEMYLLAWEKGLKTTYYLRSLAATQVEKSTTDVNRRGLQPRWMKSKSASANIRIQREA